MAEPFDGRLVSDRGDFSNTDQLSLTMMDFMIIFLDSVCVSQFAKKNRSESFVRSVAFPVAVNRGMHGSQLSQSDSAPPSFSNNRANGHQSTHIQHYNRAARYDDIFRVTI